MQQAQFDVIVDDTFQACRQLLCVKGGEYAGSEDRLGNFKRGANDTGCTPQQVLWVYLSKHLDSIKTFIRDDAANASRERSEPITGRIDDAINYLVLLKGLVVEKADPKPPIRVFPLEETPEDLIQKIFQRAAEQATPIRDDTGLPVDHPGNDVAWPIYKAGGTPYTAAEVIALYNSGSYFSPAEFARAWAELRKEAKA